MSGHWDDMTEEMCQFKFHKSKKEVEEWISKLIKKTLDEKGIEVKDE